MSTIDALASASARINLPTLVRYLRLNDWHELDHPNANIRVFGHDIENSEEPATVVIPERRALADFSARVSEAIQVIAEVQQQPIHRVLDAVLYATYDLIRARLLDRGDKISSIPLDMASRAIEHLRNFVGYSACTEADPRPFFPKATALAKDFAQLCRFGQTFVGSFGFTIECPLSISEDLGLPEVEREKPFERRVTERIATGYSFLATATETDDPSYLIDNYRTGLNANMCEELLDLYEAVEGRSIEYAISWSPELPVTERSLRGSKIVLTGTSFQQLAFAAKELEKVDEPDETTVTGPIIALRSEEPPLDVEQDTFEHTITMLWEIERGTFVRLRVPLSATEYRLACDAHKDGRPVSIRGKPEKHGKFWTLALARDFRVLIR